MASARARLIEHGRWREVREATLRRGVDGQLLDAHFLAQFLDGQLLDGRIERWLPLEDAIALAEASAEALSFDRLRDFGSSWVVHEVDVGSPPTILRSWLRSFAKSRENMVRIAPHLWKAAFRAGGRMGTADQGPGFLRLRLENVPPALLVSSACQTLLEGVGVGLLEMGELEGDVHFGPAPGRPGAMDVLVLWDT